MRDVVGVALLVVGTVVVLASCAGMAVLRDPLDRVHLATPGATVGVTAVCAALVVRDGVDAAGTAAILTAFVSVVFSPFVAHATARSIVVRRRAASGADEQGPAGPGRGGGHQHDDPGGDR